MSEKNSSTTKSFTFNVNDVVNSSSKGLLTEFAPGVNVRLFLDTVLVGHKCSNCEPSILNDGIDFDKNTEQHLSFNIEYESMENVYETFMQKYRQFNVIISIVTAEGRTLFSKGKRFAISDKKEKKFTFCYFMSTVGFECIIRKKYPQHFFICKIENVSQNRDSVLSLMKSDFTQSFKYLMNNKTLSDVTLIVKNEFKFPAHKSILYARCPYFEKMFSHQNRETSSNEVKIDFEQEPFWEVLKFIYCQEVNKLDTLGVEIFKIANYYQIDELQFICLDFLKTNLSKEKNVIEVLKLADDYGLKKLKNYAMEFFIEYFDNFGDIEEEVKELLKTNPSLGWEIITQFQTRLSKRIRSE